jgi:hypothetical protein
MGFKKNVVRNPMPEATLFLGKINTGTWHSRLGEAQKWKQ